MSILDSLFNIKTLLTISAGALISIKSLRIYFQKKEGDINVNGDRNSININNFEEKVKREYNTLWSVFSIILLFSYPIFPMWANSILYGLAFIAILMAILGFPSLIRRQGFDGIWGMFYIIGAVVAGWMVVHAVPYLDYNANRSAGLYGYVGESLPVMIAPLQYGETIINRADIYSGRIQEFIISVAPIIGYSFLILSSCYLGFGPLGRRSFDGAFKYFMIYSTISVIGALMACDVIKYILQRDFSMMLRIVQYILSFPR
ncbi:hypothetical protein [Nitrospirillum sp. BR 11163]|uniref:hypothetical protein n=1 Tax=Nitrospirillum sp. BR 11163 TaxID=3104323 RepID=UPI002AFFE7D3|nr:hypothetical protein [Nitrospirillum sp. BR 11163]MEA1673895.1 hypothetical protein [Nitrospirillum sp. BR 11163]